MNPQNFLLLGDFDASAPAPAKRVQKAPEQAQQSTERASENAFSSHLEDAERAVQNQTKPEQKPPDQEAEPSVLDDAPASTDAQVLTVARQDVAVELTVNESTPQIDIPNSPVVAEVTASLLTPPLEGPLTTSPLAPLETPLEEPLVTTPLATPITPLPTPVQSPVQNPVQGNVLALPLPQPANNVVSDVKVVDVKAQQVLKDVVLSDAVAQVTEGNPFQGVDDKLKTAQNLFGKNATQVTENTTQGVAIRADIGDLSQSNSSKLSGYKLPTATPSQLQNLRLDAPLQSKEWGQQLGSKITWLVKENVQQASIRLNPAHLGPIEVKLSTQNDQASVVFSAQHVLTRDAIEQALPKLREMLEESGLQLADAEVSKESFSEHAERENQAHSADAALQENTEFGEGQVALESPTMSGAVGVDYFA